MFLTPPPDGFRIGITDACRLYGMTPRALRLYEERGLIDVRRDRCNWRCYDRRARRRLAWISRLRSAGLSIREVAAVLEQEERCGGGAEAAATFLERRAARLEAELEQIDATLAELRDAKAAPRASAAVRGLASATGGR